LENHDQNRDQIEGRNPVLEAFRAGRPLHKIYMARGAVLRGSGAIRDAARAAGVPVVETDSAALDRMARTSNHQGVIALAAPKDYAPLEEILARAESSGRLPFLLLLDGIMDPQNLGALLRSAEAMGVDGVILPMHRAAGLTSAVGRASAGALEFMPVARVANLTRTMAELKEQGYWFIGAEPDAGTHNIPAIDRPLGLVLGGEGKGLHRLVREECDFLVSLPMYGRINSLNVSAAGAILMHEMAGRIRGSSTRP
jgi:23S rRNA (guanosine2251-2'-O)-methyltransferase